MTKKKDSNDIAAELEGISALICTIGAGLDDAGGTRVSDDVLHDACFAMSRYLDRLAEDVAELR